MKEQFFECYDGTKLTTYLFEAQKPKGVVLFLHGIQEYSKPYFPFAETLNKKHYHCLLVDQRGHGKSCKKISEIGKAEYDVFSASSCDCLCIVNMLKEKYNLPIILIGFSYGSFIVQSCLTRSKNVDKIILIGSGYMKQPKIRLAKMICNIGYKIKGANEYARPLEKALHSYFNRKFDTSWITSDNQKLKILANDKLCRVPFSYGFYKSMFDHLPNLTDNLENATISAEILLLSGEKDPVGDFGKGIKKLHQTFVKHNLNSKLIVYPEVRHNLLYETNTDEVLKDIFNFLGKK